MTDLATPDAAVPDAVISPRSLGYRRITDLPPNPDNPKLHADAEIRASIRRFGFISPIVIDGRTGLIAEGHGRTDALLAEMADSAEDLPEGIVIDEDGVWMAPVYEGWSSIDDDEARAMLVGVNRLVELGGWHVPNLTAIIETHANAGSLEGIGFDQVDVGAILDSIQAEDSAQTERVSFDARKEPETLQCPKCGTEWLKQ